MSSINTPCPNAPVRCALVTFPMYNVVDISFLVPNYNSPANKLPWSSRDLIPSKCWKNLLPPLK